MVTRAYTQVDYSKVDLGAAHNGAVAWRRIFTIAADGTGTRFIVDHGRRIPVLRISRSIAGINYVVIGGNQ